MGRKRKADASPTAVDSFTEDEGGSPAGKREPKCDSPAQRNNANARERARMRVLSKGFTKLKTALPWVPPDTKLSKLDTLRLASCYIAHLRQILSEDGAENAGPTANNNKAIDPLKLTWPYTFNGRVTASLDGSSPPRSGEAAVKISTKVKTELTSS